ncbi:MAG: ABC transporter ATP-binding protein/permease [Deltaproteobacteria bacterium]|nr:ABC transporter ATP-binding protein/permease [Deltaproteobacteria bacterium]
MRIPTRRYAATLRSGTQPVGRGMRDKIEKARDPRHTLMRLLPYLLPFRSLLILVFGLVVATTVLGLIGPYLMGLAIDRFIAVKELAGLAKISLWMLSIYLLNNLFQAVSAWLMADVSQRALKRLRGDLFSHLQTLPVRFFDSNQAGELMSRLTNDIEAVNQAVSQNVTALLASVLSLIGILIAMFVLDVWLALASLLVVPIMFLFTEFVARYTRRGFRELQKSLGDLNGVMEETISGQKVVKAFRRNESALAAFRRSNQEVFRAAVWANSYAFLLMPLTNVLGNFFVIVLAGLGGWLALKGLVSVGIIATFINYAQNFISPLRQLANMSNSIQSALAGAERVFELIDTPPEPDNVTDSRPLESIRGNVRFEHVGFSYRPGMPVIKDMTIDARAGEMFALVGPTGAGKTTLINLLTRFYEIDSGRITIDGRDIRDIGKPDLRRRLGLVLQDTFLFSGTVMENIRYGRLDATDEECIEAAKTAGADPFIRLLANGYHTGLSERAGNLSQGQRQLLSIARAIIADPAILILDEATSSVDTRTESRIHKALLSLMAGRTSFVIAHRLRTVRDAGQVLVIDDGRIVEKGTHRELIERRGFYHRLFISQFKGQPI